MGGAVKSIVGAVTSLFGGSEPETPDAPPPAKVAPTPDDEEMKRNQERQMQRRVAGAGYEGTALSKGTKLG